MVKLFLVTSSFTIAKCNPVGSRPMAKQNSITCITGNANINSITPTFLHILRKFFCRSAFVFPFVVNLKRSKHLLHPP
uniref:Uncharacterized protein n=1 Tax=Panstrongylus lignarius TaxID=156445 RepID=A0A224Y589_9HEMI